MPEVATTVSEVRRETADAVTLRLDLGGTPFPYRPGQYIRFDPHQFEELRPALGDRRGPAYFSMSSDALSGEFIEITVKEVRGGAAPPVASFLARRLQAGRRFVLDGPHGRYCLPESPPEGIEGFLHLCAGSGVAPNRGMIRHALVRGWPQRHLLLLQDRSPEEVLFREEWGDLAALHPGRFRVRHFFSGSLGEYLSEDRVCLALEGYLDPGRCLAFVCGPNVARENTPGFVDRWRGNPKKGVPGTLNSLGIRPDRILSEQG